MDVCKDFTNQAITGKEVCAQHTVKPGSQTESPDS